MAGVTTGERPVLIDAETGRVVGFKLTDGSEQFFAEPLFSAKLTCSLLPEIGPAPSWRTDGATYTAVPTIVDCYGVLRYCQANEPLFGGARRAENLLDVPADLTNLSYWTRGGDMVVEAITTDPILCGPDFIKCFKLTSSGGTSNALKQTVPRNGFRESSGVLRKVKHTFALDIYAGTVTSATFKLFVSGGATAGQRAVNLAAGWNRFFLTATPDGTSTYSVLVWPTTSGTIYVRRPQLEDMAGVPADADGNVPPSIYVSRAEITYSPQDSDIGYYHGAMVDGVRWFDTYNGNTIDHSTGRVVEADGAPIPDSLLEGPVKGPPMENKITQWETLSSWTASNLTRTPLQGTSPDGAVSNGSRGGWTVLTEDSSTTVKKIYIDAVGTFANSSKMGAQVWLEAGTQTWAYLEITNKAGTVRRQYFNLATGALASASSGVKAFLRKYGSVIHVSMHCDGSTGATTPRMAIGIAGSDGATSYLGSGKTIKAWGAMFYAKEHMVTPIPTFASVLTRTGHSLKYLAVVPPGTRNNIAVLARIFPYWNTGLIGKTNDGVTAEWFEAFNLMANVPDAAYTRSGWSFRPYADTGVPTIAACAWDRYLGNSVYSTVWKPNTNYGPGSFVVPTATKVNNEDPKQKLFSFVGTTPGLSGSSEPSWPGGFPSTVVPDGTCNWQCNHDNRTNGNYDPNDGITVLLDSPAFNQVRLTSMVTDDPGIFATINSDPGYRHTEPFPIDQSEKGDFHADIYKLQFDHAYGSYSSADTGTTYVKIYGRLPEAALLAWSSARDDS